MRNPAFLLTIMFLVIIALAAFQVVVSNKLSTSGVLISSLYKESQFYKDENEALKTQVYSGLSIASISARAKEMGFVQSNSPVIIRAGTRVALR